MGHSAEDYVIDKYKYQQDPNWVANKSYGDSTDYYGYEEMMDMEDFSTNKFNGGENFLNFKNLEEEI